MQKLTITEPQLKAALLLFVATEREQISTLSADELDAIPPDRVANVGARRLWAILSASASGAFQGFNNQPQQD